MLFAVVHNILNLLIIIYENINFNFKKFKFNRFFINFSVILDSKCSECMYVKNVLVLTFFFLFMYIFFFILMKPR